MDSISAAIVNTATALNQVSTQQAMQLAVLKTAMNLQTASAAALMQALPQPSLATSGNLGTLLNVSA